MFYDVIIISMVLMLVIDFLILYSRILESISV